MRLIDADKLLNDNRELADCDFVHPLYEDTLRDIIDDAPTVEVCKDCIRRDEAIRIAEQGQIQGYEWQFKQLCNLPSVTPTARWIPVNEGLPKTDGVYNVTRRLFDKQIDVEPYLEPYLIADACYFDGSNTWYNDNRINHSRHILEDIIAWMPLPEPYIESEE